MLPNWSYPIAWMTGMALAGWAFRMPQEMIIGALMGAFATSVMAYKTWVK
jgi:hypothetical protein